MCVGDQRRMDAVQRAYDSSSRATLRVPPGVEDARVYHRMLTQCMRTCGTADARVYARYTGPKQRGGPADVRVEERRNAMAARAARPRPSAHPLGIPHTRTCFLHEHDDIGMRTRRADHISALCRASRHALLARLHHACFHALRTHTARHLSTPLYNVHLQESVSRERFSG